MPLFIRSDFHPTVLAARTYIFDNIEAGDAIVESSFAKAYFLSLINNTDSDFLLNTSTVPPEYIFCPFEMANGNICLPEVPTSNSSLGQMEQDGKIKLVNLETNLGNYTIGSDLIGSAGALDGIIINKFYFKFDNTEFIQSAGFEEIDISLEPDRTIYINFSLGRFLRLSNFLNGEESKTFIFLKSKYQYDYYEKFDDDEVPFIDSGEFFLDPAFTEKINGFIIKTFFPYSFFDLNTNKKIKGEITSTFSRLGSFSDILLPPPDSEVCIDPPIVNPPDPPVTDVIECDGTINGKVNVYYGGILYYTQEDLQICGSTPATKIALIIRKNENALSLYKDFTALTTEEVKIYGYNFRYIKYTVDSTNYAFVDNGSLASQTVVIDNQVLDLSKYFAIKDQNGLVTALTFNFLIYISSETEASASRYYLDIPLVVNQPSILGLEVNGLKITINTNYATHIKYYLGSDSTNTTTVAVTDTNDGQNQKTSVTLPSTTQSNTINIVAYNYFYDLDGEIRSAYITDLFSYQISIIPIISSLTVQVKTSTPLTSQTFYDVNDSAITSLSITDCSQQSFSDPYRLYLNYALDDDVYFYFYFTLASGYSSLYAQIGKNFDLLKLTSGAPSVIKKSALFSRLNSEGEIVFTLWLDKKIPFSFRFIIKNYSTNAPDVTAVSTPQIIYSSYTNARMSFSTSYKYSDLIRYSVKDNNNMVLLGPINLSKESYSVLLDHFVNGTTISKSITTPNFIIDSNPNSVKILVEGFNLQSDPPFGLQSDSQESSSSTFIKRLNTLKPAEVLFFNDQAMASPAESISKGKSFYAFLQLYDFDGSLISSSNYDQYISTTTAPIFKAIESSDMNIDLNDVSVNKITSYLYEILIKQTSGFNDTSFVIDIFYTPVLQDPPSESQATKIISKPAI